jgi:hypothetical protein
MLLVWDKSPVAFSDFMIKYITINIELECNFRHFVGDGSDVSTHTR